MQKLLSITNLKKYFPLSKSSLFAKQIYNRANEDITLDIFQGETFGLVGESGCGKSTLGRVLLQLYEQTAGTTMYYGSTLASMAPRYVTDTLRNAGRYVAQYQKGKQRADELEKKCEALGDKATFFDIQQRNLAACDAQTKLMQSAKILGGFMVRDTARGAELLLAKYQQICCAEKLQQRLDAIELEIQTQQAIAEETPEKAQACHKRISALQEKSALLAQRRRHHLALAEQKQSEIEKLKEPYKDDTVFAEYEQMLDDGVDLRRLENGEMRKLRKDLQVIFQDPYSSLNPRMTIGQIIEEGLLTHRFFKRRSQKMQEYVFDIMHACGLQKYAYNRYPHQFSGGQRQRICIARALAVRPKFVVCDECVSALDVSIQSQIINLLQELKEKEGLTYLFISHNLSVVRYISDRIGVMYLGNMVEVAPTDELFRDPRHPYTIALLSSIPTTDPDSLTKERIVLEGNIPSSIHPPAGCKFHTRCFMACEKCKVVPPALTEVKPGHFVACHFADQKKVDENGQYLFTVCKGTNAR